MERLDQIDESGKEASFNPCYVGSKMERTGTTLFFIIKRCFNPCYVGSKMESHCMVFISKIEFSFQSLLCWK